MELKATEKQALIRHEAIEASVPVEAIQIDTGAFIYLTEYGLAKITISAIKDQTFDVGKAHAEYLAKVADRVAKADAKLAEKEA